MQRFSVHTSATLLCPRHRQANSKCRFDYVILFLFGETATTIPPHIWAEPRNLSVSCSYDVYCACPCALFNTRTTWHLRLMVLWMNRGVYSSSSPLEMATSTIFKLQQGSIRTQSTRTSASAWAMGCSSGNLSNGDVFPRCTDRKSVV